MWGRCPGAGPEEPHLQAQHLLPGGARHPSPAKAQAPGLWGAEQGMPAMWREGRGRTPRAAVETGANKARCWRLPRAEVDSLASAPPPPPSWSLRSPHPGGGVAGLSGWRQAPEAAQVGLCTRGWQTLAGTEDVRVPTDEQPQVSGPGLISVETQQPSSSAQSTSGLQSPSPPAGDTPWPCDMALG